MRHLLVILIFLICSIHAGAWGFYAHRKINRMAVFCLPPEMFGFYKKNIDFLTAHAPDPDRRRFFDRNEAPRHFIDIDHYGIYPFDSMPRRWKEAQIKYSEDTLLAHGILPWQILLVYQRLIKAFSEQNTEQILHLSADIGHYVADAHVPLHACENHNGQKTGQVGIHAFWESRLPELFGDGFDYFVGNASYKENILEEAWKSILASNLLADSLLHIEKSLSRTFPEDRRFGFEEHGSALKRVYSAEYSQAYYQLLNGMVERRMQAAILCLGSIWMSAWIDAGQPDLDSLVMESPDGEEVSPLLNDNREKTGKTWLGRPED